MTIMSNSQQSKHVAVFAFPFGSHLMPLLNLVLKLAHAAPNCSFSFIGTENSNAILFPKPYIPKNIKAYSISDGVPEGHVMSSNPTEKLNLFLSTGPENLQKGIELAVAETKQRVTCIIADAFVTDSLIVAKTLNVPWIPLWLPLSCSLSCHFYTDLIRKQYANNAGNRNLDFLTGLSKLCVEDLPQDVVKGGEDETIFSKTLASLRTALPQAKAVVINFFEELDPPLHKAKTVAYVSFGTVVAPPPHEIVAVAEALEESGFPFLWSLKDNLKGLLPSGFLQRIGMLGKVVPWVPQSQVLAHDSVGVFVTHSGSNSVSESICNGVPMICRPFFGDQGIGARVVQDVWENGVIIEGRVLSKNGLLKSLNLILVQEEGKTIRENALNMKKTVQDAARPEGKSAQDFKTLVEIISES
ncbi:unnamed protein product [Lupinus luteus]|uniref:Glycosyltransferase n=1 Tax=Lupinus luteus TaxID=3873 RepID=A0AAV1WRL5_LUPLU